MDVADWWRGVLSSRRLVVLVRNLTEESTTKRAMGDGWTMTDHLLVSVVNEQRLARADYAAAHGETVRPTLIPRPGEMSAEEQRQQTRDVHDALMSMVAPSPSPELVDARERLRRDTPRPALVVIDGEAS